MSAASVAGAALGRVFGALAAARGTKPLHPRGTVHPARLLRTGAPEPWCVPWLDEPGTDGGVVRLSRSVGLPAGWPDVLGLALRFVDDDGPHDLLLASSAAPPLLRHLFVPGTDPLGATYSSAFTYSTPRGPVLLGAQPSGPRSFRLQAASPTGRWQPFGELHLGLEEGDPPVDLDPVRNPLPGLRLTPALAALREPSYARARASRPDSLTREKSTA